MTLVLSERDVRELLDMESCIEAMADVLASLARGELFLPLRSVVKPPAADGFFGLMPAYRGGAEPAWALKEIVITPGNPARGLDAHQGAVLLHDGETGRLTAIMNASPVTEIRTAAVSAVATRALARPDAERVAILGAGVQARAHVHAMRAVLRDPEIRIWARRLEAAEELAGELGAIVAPSVDAALFGAEVVCTTTAAREPIVERRWLARGAHVNAVGACLPTVRELDTETVAHASLFTDRRESCLHEAGDYVLAAAEGAIGPEHIEAELGEVLAGMHPGRGSEDELTVFESLGIAVEDLAAAELVVRRARERGAGVEVEL
ncbi:MAG: ornithine cyclodeaminase [Gaiellaceae bacterium]|jgi:ornithine cyclodeaminase/alanine dehydrogenase-like protein (mu-crystallin family)|nr:MAG: ornithine cyclodeaminase [Gaiellaceae bacterium]